MDVLNSENIKRKRLLYQQEEDEKKKDQKQQQLKKNEQKKQQLKKNELEREEALEKEFENICNHISDRIAKYNKAYVIEQIVRRYNTNDSSPVYYMSGYIQHEGFFRLVKQYTKNRAYYYNHRDKKPENNLYYGIGKKQWKNLVNILKDEYLIIEGENTEDSYFPEDYGDGPAFDIIYTVYHIIPKNNNNPIIKI